MAKLKEPRMVRIEWIDSANPGGPIWSPRKQTIRPARCVSVGYVHERRSDSIVLAQSYTGGQVSGLFVIPKGCIVKIKRVR